MTDPQLTTKIMRLLKDVSLKEILDNMPDHLTNPARVLWVQLVMQMAAKPQQLVDFLSAKGSSVVSAADMADYVNLIWEDVRLDDGKASSTEPNQPTSAATSQVSEQSDTSLRSPACSELLSIDGDDDITNYNAEAVARDEVAPPRPSSSKEKEVDGEELDEEEENAPRVVSPPPAPRKKNQSKKSKKKKSSKRKRTHQDTFVSAFSDEQDEFLSAAEDAPEEKEPEAPGAEDESDGSLRPVKKMKTKLVPVRVAVTPPGSSVGGSSGEEDIEKETNERSPTPPLVPIRVPKKVVKRKPKRPASPPLSNDDEEEDDDDDDDKVVLAPIRVSRPKKSSAAPVARSSRRSTSVESSSSDTSEYGPATQKFQVRKQTRHIKKAKASNAKVKTIRNLVTVATPIKRRAPAKSAVAKKKQKPKNASSDEEEKKYPCGECPSRFKYKKNLDRHIDEVHKVPTIYKCPECQAQFTRKRSLVAHYKAIHNPDRTPFPCGKCGKIFFVRQTYFKHCKTCK